MFTNDTANQINLNKIKIERKTYCFTYMKANSEKENTTENIKLKVFWYLLEICLGMKEK